MKIDLKYYFAVILSIAGLSATIWYANLPSAAKSLTLNILSKSPLSTISESVVPGLKIFVDEAELERPALTVLTIRNNGTDPIRSDDFEGDIEILMGNEVQLIRANVIKTQPDWLKPTVALLDSQINIKPVLLNPEDSITINILSDGFPESISSRARIAGVKNVLIVDSATAKPSKVKTYVLLVVSFFVAIPTMGILFFWGELWFPPVLSVSRRMCLAILAALSLTYIGLVMSSVERLGINAFWKQMIFVYVILVLSIPFALWLKRCPPEPEKSNEST